MFVKLNYTQKRLVVAQFTQQKASLYYKYAICMLICVMWYNCCCNTMVFMLLGIHTNEFVINRRLALTATMTAFCSVLRAVVIVLSGVSAA